MSQPIQPIYSSTHSLTTKEMHTLNVNLAERSYPIHLGAGLLTQAELIVPHLTGKQVLIVTNSALAELYLPQLKNSLQAANPDLTLLSHQMPDGEEHKNLAELEKVWNLLLQEKFSRNATLIALGGGVVGDLTGFAAACYQRGINFIQIPTSLLAQVDSSVGGKTAVNHPLGKNMLGAFWQPSLVLIDTNSLKTLPPKQLAAGMAEVIKYGLLGDAEFLAWLEANMTELMQGNSELLTQAIATSCAIKAQIVAEDEREGGVRALLNLGHTFGHAIEAFTGYTDWLHGEAVAVGMCLATRLSIKIGWLVESDLDRVEKLLLAANLPIHPPKEMTPADFLEKMQLDKKNLDGQLRLILLKSLGKAEVIDFNATELLTQCLSDALQS